MKKIGIAIFLIVVGVFCGLVLLHYVVENEEPNLEVFSVPEKDKYEFTYKKNTYAIARSDNYEPGTNRVGLFLKKKEKFYLLEEIDKCMFMENAFFVKENKIYLHCIARPNEVLEYKVNKEEIEKTVRKLNFKEAANISTLHLQFEAVDNKYIYFHSWVKIDERIKEGNKVKCHLDTNKCVYNE